MPLVRRAEILVFTGQAASISAADSALLDLVWPGAEAAVWRWLQANGDYAQHVEFLPAGPLPAVDLPDLSAANVRFTSTHATLVGSGLQPLVLQHCPVWCDSIEVREDLSANAGQSSDAFADSTILEQGSDYHLDVTEEISGAKLSRTGILYRSTAWPSEPRSVRVSYFGGETAARLAGAAADIKLAMLHTIASEYWAAKNNAGSQGRGPFTQESLGKWSGSTGNGAGSAVAQAMAAAIPIKAQRLLQSLRSYKY